MKRQKSGASGKRATSKEEKLSVVSAVSLLFALQGNDERDDRAELARAMREEGKTLPTDCRRVGV